jgi:hypothetical protein
MDACADSSVLAASATMPTRRKPIDNLQSLLDRVGEECGPHGGAVSISLGEVLETVGRRAYGPLLLLIGLFAISPLTAIPGFTWLSALLVLLVAGQMALGRQTPWLPKKALAVEVSREQLQKGVVAARPWAKRIDAFVAPRFTFMTAPPCVILVALICVLAALVTFPLGLIPFAPLAPGIAVVLCGLGITARDGVLLTLGIAAVAGAVYLASGMLVKVVHLAGPRITALFG